ncbi:hypothetical protein [Allomuricauda sp.]|uniref:hypothetical protein n=1 Tax=Flagellimonas sp. TaxID=2058762 RepID=UPI001B27C61F|nr:hypothetical protein [Allomuricauda sp.]MBO6829764.1 hypothetical protein [Allomuricauda sp.]
MKNLTFFALLCWGFLCHASPTPKDTVYTNMETLMREVKTTKKKTATYYLHLTTSDDKELKVRIDLKLIDAEIPLYKSESFDIKILMALKEESLTQPNQKLEIIDSKSKEWKRLTNEANALTKELNALKADTLSLDSTAIAKAEADLQDKIKDFKKVDAEVRKIFNEYEAMMDSLMGNLRTQYHERLAMAMEEAYEKIENKETTFKSVDDDGTFWDIRLDLLKIDATREMKIPRRLEKGEETTETITAGKQYYLMHFAEFGSMFEEEEVKKVFSAIKLWEFHLNPYLVDKQFGLVCDDQYRTQHYINSVVDYKNYSGSLIEEDGSKFEHIFLEDVQWVSQIDPMYKGTSCWKWTCCNRASNEILRRSGTSTDRSKQVVIAKSSQQDCGNITMMSKEKFEEGINILKTSLKEHKLPVLIGVHHPKAIKNKDKDIIGWKEECSGNTPSITNHYVVVVGMGYDEQREQNYFRFYEVGTSILGKGTSTNNKLYLDENLKILKGTTEYKSTPEYYYITTEIRKNHEKSY